MNEVAILTYSRAYNYGAILQTYALQKYINSLDGFRCTVLDYKCNGVERQYKLSLHSNVVSLKINIALILGINKRRKIDMFRRKIPMSTMYTKETLEQSDALYDSFIVGSDQVWNEICTDSDPHFFLDFVKSSRKKNSYAASFGQSVLSDDKIKRYKMLLEDFNNISVREKSGVDIIKAILDRDCDLVLDPVFLLRKSDWEQLSIKPWKSKKYIFVYQLVSNTDVIEYASKVARNNGFKLYIMSSSPKAWKYGRQIEGAGIEEFLSYILNAELVITDSFHGSAFSILLNTPFYSYLRKNDPANTRIVGLLSTFHLESRVLNSYSNDQLDLDFDQVNKLIEKNVTLSKKYLHRVLSGIIKENV